VNGIALQEPGATAAGRGGRVPVVEVHDLLRRFGERTVLELQHWAVTTGRHCLVVGLSGSGKSTLLHLIAGLLSPTRGKIMVAGRELTNLPPATLDALRGQRIGIVLQRLHLIGALTVRDNLRLARYLAGLPPEPGRIDRLLADLGLAALAGARPGRLSQGEAQRVAIARAVVNRPDLILADEPTSALDDRNCQAVLGLLLGQAEDCGATLLVASHDARLWTHFADRLELELRP
jgi:putative ABC transport system ATP-binding protein